MRGVGRVYASTALTMAAFALISVDLPFRFQELGLPIVQYGTVAAVFALGMLATEAAWGRFAFRLARPGLVLAVGGAVAAALVAVGFAQDFPGFLVSLAVFGALSIYAIPLMRWIALTAGGPGTGGSGTSRYALFFGVGIVTGSALGPTLLVAEGFLAVVGLAIGLYLGGAVLAAALPWREVALPVGPSRLRAEMADVLNPGFLLGAALVTIYFIGFSLTVNFLQYYSVQLFGGSTADAGYVIALARATGVGAGLALAPLVDRGGPRRSAPLAFALMAGGALATWASVSYLEMIGATALFAAGCGWLGASLLPLATETVPARAQGTAVGLFGSFEDLGLFLGPIAIVSVYDADGARSIFPFVAAVGVLGAVVAALGSRVRVPIGPSTPS